MKYSVMVEYALHSLVYLIDLPADETIGIKDLAEFQGLSETYLSKVFSKLAKAGIVDSVPGVNGGYRLAKDANDISFLDVIQAVEGIKPIFQCKNILKNNLMYQEDEQCQSCTTNSACTINQVMLEAEAHMHNFLQQKTLAWLNQELDLVLPEKIRGESRNYFDRRNTD